MDAEELLEAMLNGFVILDECGCTVELDGECPCGNKSPLLEEGLI